MENEKAAALVIENIAMLEEAMKLVPIIEEKALNEIDNLIRSWSEKMGWNGTFDIWEDQTCFGPTEWQLGDLDSDDWIAAFEMNFDEKDEEKWLTGLLAMGVSRIGFRFHVYRDQLSRIGQVNVGIVAWRTFANNMNQQHPEIVKAGFQFEPRDGAWFLPWKIDAKSLAENYANDSIEDSLGPVKEALERIEAASSSFEKVVKAAQLKWP